MIMLYKRYVDVITLVDREGKLKPLILIWENGLQYPIDRILEVRNATSEVGGCGILYRCRIGSQERCLFYEKNRWFIESTKP